MMKKLLGAMALVALLAGCASGVKLDDVPVEDKSATSSGVSTSGVGAGDSQASSVAPVLADKSGSGIGPVGTAHVVLFDYDSFVVRADARPVIESHARFLQANKQRKATLEGHTDERGGREYNLALGQKRAEAVRRALSLLGVPESQLEAVSYGKEKPAAEGSDELSLAKNRRVEIRY
ncbi:peptidoglycan-associated lipoprotein Pal [Limnohabitans radicicola]|uniref:Peptidoglycan-associated lipoprotein n=1 Tax=Limnohabitans radicicola TaxID=2771427 RepID=A0A927FKH3_9BURK|nr:peptidoglycan-associated lipoprotein Pal [Limnohabitans radicicola]MBD8051190.1 peptidoglycan-associated lipoprotein Pal [Limnohabitans radicicola]